MLSMDDGESTIEDPGVIFSTPEQDRSRARAMRILGSRQLSSREMERRLVDKGETEETARETVRWMEEIGAIDDGSYAASIVRHYTGKSYGPARVRDELLRRGIPRDLWDGAWAALDEMGTDEVGIGEKGADDPVHRFLEKKLGGSQDKGDLRRATDALCRRGYGYEEARTALSRYLETIENTEKNEDEI